jgi:hypothetical protein
MLAGAEERWYEVRSGPFYVVSAAGDKAAREQMNQLEQFRFALGAALGKADLHLAWPFEVVLFKKQTPPNTAGIVLARDSYITAVTEGAGLSADRQRELARLFIDQNTTRLPGDIENGLLDLFSTVQVSGTHITLGTPPVNRSRAWARMHLLNVNPDYAGRSRVLINNLEQLPDLEVAYKNAYQKTSAQIEKQVDEYLAAGNFPTTNVSGRPFNPQHDFHALTAGVDTSKIAMADLLGAYDKMNGAVAAEGLGLGALKAGRKEEAKVLFSSAIESGTKNARAYYEAALLESDKDKAFKLLQKAAELNPLWGEVPYREALLFKDPDRRAEFLKKAAKLEPRNVTYWQTLAQNETDAARFAEAQKAWGGAERAAASAEEREKIRQVRFELQGQKTDFEAEERRRRAEEEARDLQRVKDESMAAIHAAEAKTNKKLNPDGSPVQKPVDWWQGPDAGGKIDGAIQRLDCMGKQGKLTVIGADGKAVVLLMGDPGTSGIACGVLKEPRKAMVLYNPKPDKRLGTAGEVVSIEFH